ncbi:MAG: hypothetical protein FWF99_05255 [Desulfovibrionaceae bacterium]|nr:hypothetical protein [Desulfovibrionaceae bacterium]
MSDRFQHKNLYLTICALILALALYSPSAAADLSAYRDIPEEARELLDRGESFCARSGALPYMGKDGCLSALSLLRDNLANKNPASGKPDEDPMRRWNELISGHDNRCRTLFANLHDNKGCRDLGKYIRGLSVEQNPGAVPERTAPSQRGAMLSSLDPELKLDRPKSGRYPRPPSTPSRAGQASPAPQTPPPAETSTSQPTPAAETAPAALTQEQPVSGDTGTPVRPGTAEMPAAPASVPPAFTPASGIPGKPPLPETGALPPASTHSQSTPPAPETAKTPALSGEPGMPAAPKTPDVSALPGTGEVPPSLTRTMPESSGMPASPPPVPGTLFQPNAALPPQDNAASSHGPAASTPPAQIPAPPPSPEDAHELDGPSAVSPMTPPSVVPYNPDSAIPSWPTTVKPITEETLPPIPHTGRINSGGVPQTSGNMPAPTEERQSALSAAAAATGNRGQEAPASSRTPDSFADIIPNFVPPPPPVPTQGTPMPAGQGR